MRLVAAALIALAGVPALAQRPQPPRPPATPPAVGEGRQERTDPTSESARGQQVYSLALRMLANGQADEAIALLEDLRAADPASIPVWLKLQEAYVAGRRFDDAIRIIDDFQEQNGPSVSMMAQRGVLLFQSGSPDEARDTWDRAIAIEPETEQTYRTVANEISEVRLFADAAAVLDRGRTALRNDDAFLLERAHLYGLAADYQSAIEAYLQVLARPGQSAGGVTAQLGRMIEGLGAPEAFNDAVSAAVTRDPLNRAYRDVAAWLAMERADYPAALDAYRAIDRLERENGQSLLRFALAAQAAGELGVAGRALDEVLERHKDGPFASQALIARAEIGTDLGRAANERPTAGPSPNLDSARDAYRSFLALPNSSQQRGDAALAWANLERDGFQNYARADSLLMIAFNSGDPNIAGAAKMGLGEVEVRKGDLEAARQHYTEVEEALRIGPLADQARYDLALLDFYEGYPLSALARVEAMDDNTAADVSNDAIGLRVTLNENAGPDSTSSALEAYASARLLHRRGLLADALAVTDSLVSALPTHEIGDEVLYLHAQVLRDLNRPEEANAALDLLAERFATSFFRDRALMIQAETLEHALMDPVGAAERYEQVLIDFPGSLFVPDARANLRRLRTPS